MTTLPLITRYRPASFDEMVGNPEAVVALSNALLGDGRPHAYLFTGPSGIGKTTMARISAHELGAEVLEIDAASNNGVEASRALADLAAYKPFGAARRMIIVDECHALSKQAWQPLLKVLEDAPDHLYFALATTELGKVPETIVTRCFHVALRPLRVIELEEYLATVAELEGWSVSQEILTMVVREATGQPRKGLSLLDAVHTANSPAEAQRIIAMGAPGDSAARIAKFLLNGGKGWKALVDLCRDAEEEEWAVLGLQVCRYLIGCIIRSQTDEQARTAFMVLTEMSKASPFDDKVRAFTALGETMALLENSR